MKKAPTGAFFNAQILGSAGASYGQLRLGFAEKVRGLLNDQCFTNTRGLEQVKACRSRKFK